MKTWVPKGQDQQPENRKWFVVDAEGVNLGRLCTRVANILTGKNKPTYTPHADMGDNVIVINAAKVAMTGNKFADKMYFRHSGYPGGIKEMTAGEKLEKKPESFIKDAVKGMLPKTKLGKQMLTKLKVYEGAEHGHEAQKPETVNVTDLR